MCIRFKRLNYTGEDFHYRRVSGTPTGIKLAFLIFGFRLTISVDFFGDFPPDSQICKDFFQSSPVIRGTGNRKLET